jgi:hypothetical protein
MKIIQHEVVAWMTAVNDGLANALKDSAVFCS